MVQIFLEMRTDCSVTQSVLDSLRLFALTSRGERGCLNSRISVDPGDSNVLAYLEEWSSAEDMNRHIQTEAFSRLLALMETASVPPEFELRFVHDVQGLEYVAALRGDTMVH